MTLLDSICCTCAISSLRTAGFCRRYGWRSGGPWVSYHMLQQRSILEIVFPTAEDVAKLSE